MVVVIGILTGLGFSLFIYLRWSQKEKGNCLSHINFLDIESQHFQSHKLAYCVKRKVFNKFGHKSKNLVSLNRNGAQRCRSWPD